MIPHWVLFWFILFGTCGYALWRGRKYERITAIVCITATVVSSAGHVWSNALYLSVSRTDTVIDSAVLFAFIAIALVSDRFWPLWVAGLQLVGSGSHLMRAMDENLLPRVYATAERFWSLPILLILVIGAWRQHRRRIEARRSEAEAPAAGLTRSAS
jgi:hypothetical protein